MGIINGAHCHKCMALTAYLAANQNWQNDVAEFHGDFVDMDPLYCWPKPVQPQGPPVLIGAQATPIVVRHIVGEYADGWIPLDGLDHDHHVSRST
jgi:alkanesulfonate monooxygenase SsuD/methylene tetrahydromethanopterin reductase-like flavin-dependent oxidoreductase (luciferase family)